MDYEKKYKEALEKARQLCAYPTTKPFISDLQDLFPELKESKDEKMRKGIIRTLKRYANCVEEGDDAPSAKDFLVKNTEKQIAWLEKQGKSALESWKDMRLEVYQQASGNRHEPNYSDDTTKMFSLNDIDEIFEKIAEKKELKKLSQQEVTKISDQEEDFQGCLY